jgi:hypothetical protein
MNRTVRSVDLGYRVRFVLLNHDDLVTSRDVRKRLRGRGHKVEDLLTERNAKTKICRVVDVSSSLWTRMRMRKRKDEESRQQRC